jgi:hypothetical protein
MPLVTISVCKPKSAEFKSLILDTIHLALQHVGVPATDKFQRVLELDAEDFRFDTGYPDVQGARTSDFVLIEILWSLGRSVKVKKEFLSFLMQEFSKNLARKIYSQKMSCWCSKKPSGKTGRLPAAVCCTPKFKKTPAAHAYSMRLSSHARLPTAWNMRVRPTL